VRDPRLTSDEAVEAVTWDPQLEPEALIPTFPYPFERMSADFTGLSLVAPSGLIWQWVGHVMHVNRRGLAIRLDRWQGTCRRCSEPFLVLAKLPSTLHQRYLSRRVRALEARQPVDVRLVVTADRRIKAFELVHCKAHRLLRGGYRPRLPRAEDLV
jgi:hypothetical protein